MAISATGISAHSHSYGQNFDIFDIMDDLTKSKGQWVKYDITHMSYDECKRLSENLTADSRCETVKSILYVAMGILALIPMVTIEVILGEMIVSFFSLTLGMPNLGMGLFLVAYVITLIMLTFQWTVPIFSKAGYFWDHSNHLDEQERACADRMLLLQRV